MKMSNLFNSLLFPILFFSAASCESYSTTFAKKAYNLTEQTLTMAVPSMLPSNVSESKDGSNTTKVQLEGKNLADLILAATNGSTSSTTILGAGVASSTIVDGTPLFEQTASLNKIEDNLKDLTMYFPKEVNEWPTIPPVTLPPTTQGPFIAPVPTPATIVSLVGQKGNLHIGGFIGDYLNQAQIGVKVFAANVLAEVVPAIVSISNSTDITAEFELLPTEETDTDVEIIEEGGDESKIRINNQQ